MPALFDIGTTPGTAMAGDDYRVATPGTAGLVPVSNGALTAVTYDYPPGYLLLDDVGVQTTMTTSATEYTILAGGAVANLWPTFVAAGDMVSLVIGGTYIMNASAIPTIKVYFGATAVTTLAASTASTLVRNWFADLRFIMNSSTSVVTIGQQNMRSANGTGWVKAGTIDDVMINDGAAVTVTAAPQTFDIKAQASVGNASSFVTMKTCQLRYYAKGR